MLAYFVDDIIWEDSPVWNLDGNLWTITNGARWPK